RRGAGVDPGEAGVRVGRGPGVDRVAEAALLPDLLEQAARHAAAEHLVGHGEGVAVVVAVADAPPAEGDVGLLGGLAAHDPLDDLGRRRPADGPLAAL